LDFRSWLEKRKSGMLRTETERSSKKISRQRGDFILKEELSEDYIIPSVLNRKVPEQVSNNVREAAIQTGVARLEHGYFSFYKVG
jgi:malate dehydrogenase (oxaloacetate-decarboxylating)